MDPFSIDPSSFPSLFVDVAIKQEPEEPLEELLENQEVPTESKVCTKCFPFINFPTVKDKLLHDFFQHAQVTSVDEPKVDERVEEAKETVANIKVENIKKEFGENSRR